MSGHLFVFCNPRGDRLKLLYWDRDGHGGYDGVYAGEKTIEVLCWAHARRMFFDAQGSDAERAVMALAYVRRLYAVEREAKELFEGQGVTQTSRPLSAIRLELRQEKSAPLLAAFKPWLQEQTAGPSPVLPKSPMGQAINYGLNNWDALERYTTNGGLDIDNNAAERAMRPVALIPPETPLSIPMPFRADPRTGFGRAHTRLATYKPRCSRRRPWPGQQEQVTELPSQST